MKTKSSRIPNLWHIANTVLRGKCIISNVYVRKIERCKINYLSFCPKKLEREEQRKWNPNYAEGKK